MRGISSRTNQPEATEGLLDKATRSRVAVELIRDHEKPLRWTAHRYSICGEDAEDAYQRGIEILLSKAPTAEMRQLLPWTRTVIKHEALAIKKARERILPRSGPATEDDDQGEGDWIQAIPAIGDGPDELTVRRERVARSREALAQLKPAELKALTQLAEGFSYQEIASLNRWSRTKVNRCLAEGRARFRSAFKDSEAGDLCAAFEPLISASCDGELPDEKTAELQNHLAACGYCRSTLRAYRAAPKAAAALMPLVPAGRGIWERAQELVVDLQLRFQGLGRSSDAGVQTVLASGGSSGAGIAATAKLVTICAGTAGTAAVCAATGVLPGVPLVSEQDPAPKVRERAAVSAPEPAPRPPAYLGQSPQAPAVDPQPKPEGAESKKPEPAPETAEEKVEVPAPTPTDVEFTPESAGTPAPVPVPTAPPDPGPVKTSSVPVGNGGGEFSP